MKTVRWTTGLVDNVDTTGDWSGDTAPSSVSDARPLDAGGGLGVSATVLEKTRRPTLTTLVSFNGADGQYLSGNVIEDAAGDLFGTAFIGGNGSGTVYEIAKTHAGYASAPTLLADFAGSFQANPTCGLIAAAAGDLFGTTELGGADDDGTVFEIAKTQHGYASPTTLVSFSGGDGETPQAALIADSAGDLFGTTFHGGADGRGAVFEIARTKGGFAGAPTTLVSFTGANGEGPSGALIADAAGNLFGTTSSGGVDGDGTVFEIAKTLGGYAAAPTTLVSFTGADGSGTGCALVADAAGDLFGTTSSGGVDGDGTVFEIARTQGGYAGKPTTLVSFTGADGSVPEAALIVDPAGDLFGTTGYGGADGYGTVFEIAKTEGGYATTPTTLVSFTGADGTLPAASLTADVAGDLFGTTFSGGADGRGTVFEITHSGFVPPAAPATSAAAGISRPSPAHATFVQALASFGAGGFAAIGPQVLAARNDVPMLLSRPHAAY